MDKVSEITSSKLSDAIINYRQWGEMYYNVQNYGVLPGGVDVTVALQTLVNKATAENRTAIFFPPGDYRVTAITNDANVWYVGDNARFIGGYTKTINLIGTNPGTNTGVPNPHASTHVTGGTDVIPNAVAGGNSGLMSGADKTKLNGIANNANNYTHPATHPPSIIVQDANNRFVTDAQITQWTNGGGPGFGKVNDIQAAVANDTLTITAGTGISVSTNPTTKTVTVTAQGSSAPGAHASTHITGGSDVIPNAVSGGNSGLMSGADKQKLDAATNAATASTLVMRDASGRAKVAAPSASDDIARKQEVDAVTTALTTHTSDTVIHVTQADKDKWNAGTGGGGGGGTTASVTYYVNSSTGSDSNNGLSAATAFQTIQKAVDSLPKQLNHDCTINLAGSQTYTVSGGFLMVYGFFGVGRLTIKGPNSTTSAVISGGVSVYGCANRGITISNLSFTGDGFYVEACTSVFITTVVSTAAGSYGVSVTRSTYAEIGTCTLSNKTSAAIYCYGSRVFSIANTGTGNSVGLQAAYAGTIGKSGTQPAGSTAESVSLGGVIRA